MLNTSITVAKIVIHYKSSYFLEWSEYNFIAIYVISTRNFPCIVLFKKLFYCFEYDWVIEPPSAVTRYARILLLISLITEKR